MLLVTGGTGYIGSHFIKRYLERTPGVSVSVADNLSEGHLEALDNLGPALRERISFEEVNIGDVPVMERLMAEHGIDAVVHFAASCYVGESQTNPAKYYRNNTIHTLGLLEAMQNRGVKRLVFSSTCATYGNPVTVPLDESHPQAPINVYGLTKLLVEKAILGYHQTIGLNAVMLRYFNAAGADDSGLIGECHEPETHLIPLVLQAALGKRPAIEVFGTDYPTPDGTCIRDYIHINDLADAHCLALEKLAQGGPMLEAVNLGTAKGASVQEIITLCEQVSGLPVPVKHSPRRWGDPDTLVANAAKAKALLGWEPQYDLRRVIETAWKWEQNRAF